MRHEYDFRAISFLSIDGESIYVPSEIEINALLKGLGLSRKHENSELENIDELDSLIEVNDIIQGIASLNNRKVEDLKFLSWKELIEPEDYNQALALFNCLEQYIDYHHEGFILRIGGIHFTFEDDTVLSSFSCFRIIDPCSLLEDLSFLSFDGQHVCSIAHALKIIPHQGVGPFKLNSTREQVIQEILRLCSTEKEKLEFIQASKLIEDLNAKMMWPLINSLYEEWHECSTKPTRLHLGDMHLHFTNNHLTSVALFRNSSAYAIGLTEEKYSVAELLEKIEWFYHAGFLTSLYRDLSINAEGTEHEGANSILIQNKYT